MSDTKITKGYLVAIESDGKEPEWDIKAILKEGLRDYCFSIEVEELGEIDCYPAQDATNGTEDFVNVKL